MFSFQAILSLNTFFWHTFGRAPLTFACLLFASRAVAKHLLQYSICVFFLAHRECAVKILRALFSLHLFCFLCLI